MTRLDARRLDDWAALHGEPVEPEAAPTLPVCTLHGPYTPHSLLDADCPVCDREDYRAWQNRRHDIAPRSTPTCEEVGDPWPS